MRNGINKLVVVIIIIGFYLAVNGTAGYSFQVGSSDVQQLKAFSNAFVQVAKEVTPAVVCIQATKVIKISASDIPQSGDLPELFRRMFPPQQQEQYETKVLGSGVIYDKEGYIITNNHVVSDTKEIIVRLQDKRKFTAKLIGADPNTDVALIKINGENLPVARLGNSDNVNVGEWVLAIGTPFDSVFNSTVTAGIISSLGRNLNIIKPNKQSYKIEDFIQTDAVINPGNSGGPLVNLNGEVIAINSAIASSSGLYEGYGFAIPINLVKAMVEDLRKYGKIVRGVIGISFRDFADQDEMKKLKSDDPNGLLVTNVTSGFPGEKAGIKVNDVIVGVNDKKFRSSGQFQTFVATMNPGDKVKLSITRDGKPMDIWVLLGDMPAEVPQQQVQESEKAFNAPGIGLNVSENQTNPPRVQGEAKGVIVTSVKKGSEAERKNIKLGDIIYKVEKIEINSVSDFKTALEQYKTNKTVLFYIRNDDGWHLVNIELQ